MSDSNIAGRRFPGTIIGAQRRRYTYRRTAPVAHFSARSADPTP
jgi:hypothetical protein